MKVRSSPRTGRTVIESEHQEAPFPPGSAADIRVKRILVPLDFSKSSSKALHYAISLARQFGAEIDLVHVMTVPVYFEGPAIAVTADYEKSRNAAAGKQMEEWRAEVPHEITVRTELRTGSPYHEIILAADETNTDLIIMGTHGRSGVSHMLIGSTAERVVRQAPCPVLTVREREHDFVETEENSPE